MRFFVALAALPAVATLCAGEDRLLFARLGDIRVAYTNHGRGSQAVVFVHGWTCDHTFWARSVPAIAAKRRVIAVDLPGHGASDKPETAYSLDLFARGVEAVLREAGVNKAVLAGHSMGTAVSAKFLQLFPERVAGIIIVDGFLPQKPADAAGRQKVLAPFREDYAKTATSMINGMFVEATTTELRQEILSKMLATPRHVGISAMERMAEIDAGGMKAPHVPALALMKKRPERDEAFERFLRGIFPKLDYQAWDGAGHFLMMEQPERFNREVLAFLDRHKL